MCNFKKIQELNISKQIDIFNKIHNGDNKLREKVILANMPLIEVLVWREFGSSNYDKEDLIMIGNQELIKAVDTYDPTKNTTFSYYACLLAKRKIIKFLYKEDREWFYSFCSINNKADKKDETTYLDMIDSNYSVEKIIDRNILLEETSKFLSKLSNYERDMFIMYYFKGMSQSKIANFYGMKNHTTVSYNLRKNKKLLQEALEKTYINNDTDLGIKLTHKMYL